MESLSGWGMSSLPWPPPRQHEHEWRYTPFMHPFILRRRIWKDDYDGQMIFGDHVGLSFVTFVLQVRINPENLTQEICPDREPNPGPLRDRRACYRLLHSGGLTRIQVKNHLILPQDQIYSPLLCSKISDLIFLLNFFLLSGKSGEVMLPLHSVHSLGYNTYFSLE